MKLYIRFFCQEVFMDSFGNRFFIATQKTNYLNKLRRYVIFSEDNYSLDTSIISVITHAWLHYLIDDIEDALLSYKKHNWYKQNLGNKTGAAYSYNPFITDR